MRCGSIIPPSVASPVRLNSSTEVVTNQVSGNFSPQSTTSLGPAGHPLRIGYVGAATT